MPAWERWLARERRLSPHTCRAYQRDVRAFLTFLSEHLEGPPTGQALADLHVTDFRAFLAAQTRNGLGARGRGRCLSSLRSFLTFLAERTGLEAPALSLLRRPRIAPALPKPLDKGQLAKLFTIDDSKEDQPTSWQDTRDRALFGLLYGCGLRLAEALSLSENQALKDVLRVTGKGGRTRQIPVLPAVRRWLEEYRRCCPFHGHNTRDPDTRAANPCKHTNAAPLFVGQRGGRLNPAVARDRLKSLAGRLGLPTAITPHTLRHSFATHLLQSSGQLRIIQELLGHESLRATQVYVGVAPAELREIHQRAHPRHRLETLKPRDERDS